MKKMILGAAAVALTLLFVISCAKNSPVEPVPPASTLTATVSATITPTHSGTPTITETFTATPTDTDTPPFTATPTATITVTSTSTPPDLWVDDFEDGDLLNPISSWGANTLLGTTIHFQGLITPPPGSGSYSFAVTATADIQTGNTMAYVNLSTGPVSGATPMNASAYNKLRFGRLFNGTISGGSKSVYVTIYGATNFVQYSMGAVFSPVFEEWDIGLRASYFLSGGTLDEVLGNITQINVSAYITGSPGEYMDFNLVIDDVRFTHN